MTASRHFSHRHADHNYILYEVNLDRAEPLYKKRKIRAERGAGTTHITHQTTLL